MRPGWTHSNKSGVGTAYSTSSRLWFTTWKGIVTEVSYPTIDRPQLRDVQYLITDGKSFFHEEKRHLAFDIERISEETLGYRCTNTDPAEPVRDRQGRHRGSASRVPAAAYAHHGAGRRVSRCVARVRALRAASGSRRLRQHRVRQDRQRQTGADGEKRTDMDGHGSHRSVRANILRFRRHKRWLDRP